jgi:hypothetical protein
MLGAWAALGGCRSHLTSSKKPKSSTLFSYYTRAQYHAAQKLYKQQRKRGKAILAGKARGKGTDSQAPPYGCFVDVHKGAGPKPWKDWSIALHFSDAVLKKANGHKVMIKVRIQSAGADSLVRMANCVAPDAQQAIAVVKKLTLRGANPLRTVYSPIIIIMYGFKNIWFGEER